MIPSGMTTIPIPSTARIIHTGADTHTTTTTTVTVTTPGIPATVIHPTTMAAMNLWQKPDAGEDTAQWHVDLTPLLIPGANQGMHPEGI